MDDALQAADPVSGPVAARASDEMLEDEVRTAQAARVPTVRQQAIRWQAIEIERLRAENELLRESLADAI